MIRPRVTRLTGERGDALIAGLLALGLVLLVICFAAQAVAYVHARNIAEAAAQDGASDAATGGPQAGVSRAQEILTAAGGAVLVGRARGVVFARAAALRVGEARRAVGVFRALGPGAARAID